MVLAPSLGKSIAAERGGQVDLSAAIGSRHHAPSLHGEDVSGPFIRLGKNHETGLAGPGIETNGSIGLGLPYRASDLDSRERIFKFSLN